jgi:endoglucanase
MTKRACWISLCLVCACACSSTPIDTPLVEVPPSSGPNPFWHADGEQIVDGNGERVVIRGVNVGGWLIWENWMWGGGWQGETTMRAKFVEAVGEAEADRFAQRVHDTFITVDDIGAISDLGFNVVRLNINHSLVEEDANPGTLKPQGMRRLDDIVGWCEAYGIGVLLDLHAAPGGQSWTYMNDPDPTGLLWHDVDKRRRTVKLWRMLAEHFADNAAIVGYDLLNEPWPSSDEDLFALYADITAAITEVDPRHMIVVEGTRFASVFEWFPQRLRDNVAYSFHQYTPGFNTRQPDLDRHKLVVQTHGVPMFCGEFGEDSVEMVAGAVADYENPENHLSGHILWSWKKVLNNTPALVEIDDDMPKWRALMDWTNNGWFRPSPDDTLAAFDEFIDAIALEHCTIHDDMAAAALRP